MSDIPWKRLSKLLEKEYRDWTVAEVLEVLTDRYKDVPTPKCHLCGEEMGVQAMGGGHPTVYACSGDYWVDEKRHWKPGRSFADEHYSKSCREIASHGDELVIEALRRWKLEREAHGLHH